jgi:4-amino-4-deoxy-L-arabinose transferase-like glycosyltransferase
VPFLFRMPLLDDEGRFRLILTRRREIISVAAILLVAVFLRFYRLEQLPPGLHYDEAFNATQAQKVLAGVERPLVFSEDLTEEPTAIYAAAVFFALFGASPFSLRLVSAVVGVLTIAALYALARQLLPSRQAALLSTFILAILYWHINFSRLGMEPIFLPLMLTAAIAFWARSLRTNAPFDKGSEGLTFALAGLFLSLSLYTYKSALFVPILFGVFIATEILTDKGYLVRNSRNLALLILVAVLVFVPLGLYWATHPSEFIERPSSVLVGPSALANNVAQVSGMFFLHGDENPRSNLPGRSVLDPLLAIGFIAGIVVSIASWRRVESRLLLLWLVIMVLPSVLTDFAPHFGRSIGAAPAVALITGVGFVAVIEKMPKKPFAYSLLALALALSTFSTFHDYFDTWASRSGQFDSFDVGLLSLAQKLHAEPPNETIFISPVDANHYTIQFGLNGINVRSFDGRRVLALPEPGAVGAYGIIARDDARSLARLRTIYPAGRVVDTIYDYTAQPYAIIYHSDGPPVVNPQKRVDAHLGDIITLIGYDFAPSGNELALTLYWGSIAETREDYTVFVHLLSDESQVITQDDAKPGHGTYLTTHWHAGQVILDDYRMMIPASAPPGEYDIEIGMYTLETGMRVRMTDATGGRLENDRVLVERFAYP